MLHVQRFMTKLPLEALLEQFLFWVFIAVLVRTGFAVKQYRQSHTLSGLKQHVSYIYYLKKKDFLTHVASWTLGSL